VPAPDESTTAPGTFRQGGGTGTISATGNGDRPGGAVLDYDFPSTDLRGGGSNTQLLLELGTIERVPAPPTGQPALQLSITVGDSVNGSSSYDTVLGNSRDSDVAVNFDCIAGSTPCFRGTADLSRATHLSVRVVYPTNNDATGTLDAVIETIESTPAGLVVPVPPTPVITEPADDPVYGTAGTVLEFPVDFRSDGRPVPVSHAPDSTDGLRAGDVTVTGTAAGVSSVTVTGGPAKYLIKVGPLTASGTVEVRVAAGALNDAWEQPTRASSLASVRFVLGLAPDFTTAAPPDGRAGARYSHQFAAGGDPLAGYRRSAGALPPGLRLSSAGLLTGTPTAGGSFTFTVRASNALGSDTQPVTVVILEPPTITSPAPAPVFTSADTATVTGGRPGRFEISTTGRPGAKIGTDDALPPGLALTDHGDGTATISGTATGPAGRTPVVLIVQNAAGTGTQTLTIEINTAPEFTGADTATFTVGVPGRFAITTGGRPDAMLKLGDALPAGLALADNGDGTATISGTPAAPGSTTTATVIAANRAGQVSQELTVTVQEAPVITRAGPVTFTAGAAGAYAITAAGFPVPALTAASLPEGLALTDHGDGTATISGTPSGPAATAVVALTATSSAGEATANLAVVVNSAPVVTSTDQATFDRGVAGSFAITAAGDPAPVIATDDALPDGLTLTDHGDGTATVSGTPIEDGAFVLDLTAGNPSGTARQGLSIVVRSAPEIHSAEATEFTVGEPASFAVAAEGYPAPGLTLRGSLPVGLTFTDQGNGSARIAGTPEGGSAGRYAVEIAIAEDAAQQQVTARTAGSVTQQLIITVRAAPTGPSPRPSPSPTGIAFDPGHVDDGDDDETNIEGLASTGGPALAAAAVGLVLALAGTALITVSRRRGGRLSWPG
jgi:hypothetical protein